MRALTPQLRRCIALAAAIGSIASTALSGCSSGEVSSRSPVDPMSWERVRLPAGLTPVTVTRMGHKLLVGARDESARLAPQLLLLDHGAWSSVPLQPKSYYAYRARWRSVITDGRQIFAFGDAPGGAHSNPRWTTWAGTVDRVREYPQLFETFGGWGAGGLTGMTMYREKPLIIGSWSSENVGLDVAVWSAHGTNWLRHSSSGTALASNKRALNIIRAVGEDSDGLVLSGAITRLGDGEVSLEPALWRRNASSSSWVRVDLPASGAGEATGVRCGESSCLAAGYVDGQLAVWSVGDQGAKSADGLPEVSMSSDSVALVGPPGSQDPSVLATSDRHSLILTEGSDGWSQTHGPAGIATAWALAGGRTYVMTTQPGGESALWAGELR